MADKRIVALVCLVISLASLRHMYSYLPTIKPYENERVALRVSSEHMNYYNNISMKASSNVSAPLIQDPIPHILWFTYKHDILQKRDPEKYYDNIMKIIAAYRSDWGKPDAPVRFLVDDNCTVLLEEVDKKEGTRLAEAFQLEGRGDLRADLCRLAALYLHGGYYFDVDIEVVKPLQLDPKTSFCTVRDSLFGYFFQAFLAAIPGHPILRENLNTMMEFYFERNGTCFEKARGVVGPCTLAKAWNQTENRGYTRMLKETNLKWHGLYPNMTQRGDSDACHWVVHDPKEMQVYFYSRILGSSKCW